MDGNEDRAHLEWWANRSSCLARIPVRLAAGPGSRAWDAVVSPPLDRGAREDMQFLIEASPYFTLRFGDDSVTEVEVERAGDPGRATAERRAGGLTSHLGPAIRQSTDGRRTAGPTGRCDG
ncbi:hypothetical protein ACFQ51_19270 [Streptomyces kaempferi]